MSIHTINRENVNEYADRLDPDIAENIGRDGYYGLAWQSLRDAKDQALIVWRLQHLRQGETTARILQMQAQTAVGARAVLKAYEDTLREAHAVRSVFEFPENTDDCCIAELERAGYEPHQGEQQALVVTVDELRQRPFVGAQPLPAHVTGIGELTIDQMRRGVQNCLLQHREGSLEDLYSLPLHWFDPEVSCCLQEDGKVYGLFLVHCLSSGGLTVELMYAAKPATKNDLVHLMRYAISTAADMYEKDTPVLLRRSSEVARAITGRMFPDKKGNRVIVGEKALEG